MKRGFVDVTVVKCNAMFPVYGVNKQLSEEANEIFLKWIDNNPKEVEKWKETVRQMQREKLLDEKDTVNKEIKVLENKLQDIEKKLKELWFDPENAVPLKKKGKKK
jgi:gas vesicle protein